MFRNYLMAALRNLLRNRLYAGTTILGLAVGFTAAILIGLFVRDEFSYDRWIAGFGQVYRLDTSQMLPGQQLQRRGLTVTSAAGYLRLDHPEIAATARMTLSQSALRAGAIEGSDRVMWSDRDLFTVLPMPVIAGDLKTALATPDGVVITRSIARKYFGNDTPLGATIEINPALDNLPNLPASEAQALGSFHPMRVTAVIEDLPANTHLNIQIFAAAEAAFSPMRHWDAMPASAEVYAYLRLRDGAPAAGIQRDLPAFSARHYAPADARAPGWAFNLTPLTAVHLTPASAGALKPSGDIAVITAIAAVGALIVLIAAINFVTLVTARATRRAVEVGVRKVAGANRSHLALQFMGEALLDVSLSMLFALALAELALPHLNAFLQRDIHLDYLHDAALLAAIVATTLTVGLLAGIYPALVLSSFRPAAVLKGGGLRNGRSGSVRQVLVLVQFAVLVTLIVVTATIYRQAQFALRDALALDTDQIVSIYTPCSDSFKQQITSLAGVKAAACASSMVLVRRPAPTSVSLADGSLRTTQGAAVDVGFLEMHGLRPLAGRFFAADRGTDVVLLQAAPPEAAQPNVVVNASAVRRLGFRTPQEAVGKTIVWGRYDPSLNSRGGPPPLRASQIIGVTRDFSLGSVRLEIEPTLYYVDPRVMLFTTVRLSGRDVPETLAGIDRVVRRIAPDKPVQRSFESQSMQNLYADILTQATVVAACAALAVFIACLGLFGLAAFTAEQRTKEIGIRKVMGATSADVMKLLLWQFSKPVLWANLIAWPLAALAMNRWLNGFAYHVELAPWLFLAATLLALAIGLLTVSTHCYRVARARPVGALRYE